MITVRPSAWRVMTPPRVFAGLDFSDGRDVAELRTRLAKTGVVLALVVVPVKHRAGSRTHGSDDLIGANRFDLVWHAGGLQLGMFVGKRYSGR